MGNSIELFSHRITDADVAAVVDTITSGAVVVEALYLCVNLISDAGAAALARLFHVSGGGPRCGAGPRALRP